jgi:hypothetical protein
MWTSEDLGTVEWVDFRTLGPSRRPSDEPPPEESPDGPPPSPDRIFWSTFGRAWGLTALGGGGCGLVCAGYVSVGLFVFTVPVGLVLGAILGIPVGLVLGLVFARLDPAKLRPEGFVTVISLIGMGIALAIDAPYNMATVGDALRWHTTSAPIWLELSAIACIAASAAIGWFCGWRLAVRHLDLCRIPRQFRGTSRHGSSRSVRTSPGSPSTRSPRMFFITSVVPPSIELARIRRNAICGQS